MWIQQFTSKTCILWRLVWDTIIGVYGHQSWDIPVAGVDALTKIEIIGVRNLDLIVGDYRREYLFMA